MRRASCCRQSLADLQGRPRVRAARGVRRHGRGRVRRGQRASPRCTIRRHRRARLHARGRAARVRRQELEDPLDSAPGIVVSEITLVDTPLVAISCGSGVTAATGNVTITGNLAATSIDCGSVITVGGSVDVTGNTSAGSVDLGALLSAGGSVDITGNTSAGSVDLASLTVGRPPTARRRSAMPPLTRA